MKPTLSADWKHILKKAWSMRLNAVAFLLMSAELVLPIFSDVFPRRVFAGLSIAALAGSMWARLLRQKGFTDDH